MAVTFKYVGVNQDGRKVQGEIEAKEAGNAHWLENGKEMQAKFDEVVTCNSPDIYDSWMLLNNTEE